MIYNWDRRMRKIQKMINLYEIHLVRKIKLSFFWIGVLRTEGRTEEEDTQIALEKRILQVSSEYNIPVEEIKRLLPKIKPSFVLGLDDDRI